LTRLARYKPGNRPPHKRGRPGRSKTRPYTKSILMLLVLDVGNHQYRCWVCLRPGTQQTGVRVEIIADEAESPHDELLVRELAGCNCGYANGGRIWRAFSVICSPWTISKPKAFAALLSLRSCRRSIQLSRKCASATSIRSPCLIRTRIENWHASALRQPAEVGADRIVNSVAAFEKYGGPCIVVDFGTATTFDCVSAKGEYHGRCGFAQAIGISADALFERTARLTRVDIRKPAHVIGSNTVSSPAVGALLRLSGIGRRSPGIARGRAWP